VEKCCERSCVFCSSEDTLQIRTNSGVAHYLSSWLVGCLESCSPCLAVPIAGAARTGACITGVSCLRGTNTGANDFCQIDVESLLNEVACQQEMHLDVKGVLCEVRGSTALFLLVLPSEQPKNAIFQRLK
jgi:hypothetical protein